MCDEGIIPAEPECVKILQLDGDSLTCTVWRTLVLGAEEEKGLYDFPYGGAQKKRKAVDRVTLSVSKIQITKTKTFQIWDIRIYLKSKCIRQITFHAYI